MGRPGPGGSARRKAQLRRRLLGRAAGQIFAANVTVLDDTGRQTARFVTAFLESFSATLMTIEFPELEHFLCDWDRTPDSLAGSAARDLTKLSGRMSFIVNPDGRL